MARALGMEVLGLTLVTNKAGRADNNHAGVLQTANAAAGAANIALGGPSSGSVRIIFLLSPW